VIVLVGLTEKQKADLPSGIIGITRTDSIKELAEIYSVADVFVNPTLEDNFPTTHLEALACGTPVIAFNTGGSAESISERCGHVVQRGHLDDMMMFIRLLKEDGKETYSNACIERATCMYDKDDRFADYVELYESFT